MELLCLPKRNRDIFTVYSVLLNGAETSQFGGESAAQCGPQAQPELKTGGGQKWTSEGSDQ